jgi:hypothetical protein
VAMEADNLGICRGDHDWCGYRILSLERCGTASLERHDPTPLSPKRFEAPVRAILSTQRSPGPWQPLTTRTKKFTGFSRIEAVSCAAPPSEDREHAT